MRPQVALGAGQRQVPKISISQSRSAVLRHPICLCLSAEMMETHDGGSDALKNKGAPRRMFLCHFARMSNS